MKNDAEQMMRGKFGIRNSEFGEMHSGKYNQDTKWIVNSEFGTVLCKFGIRNSEFGDNVTSARRQPKRYIRENVTSARAKPNALHQGKYNLSERGA